MRIYDSMRSDNMYVLVFYQGQKSILLFHLIKFITWLVQMIKGIGLKTPTAFISAQFNKSRKILILTNGLIETERNSQSYALGFGFTKDKSYF